jgi:hypothetical protein
MRTNFSQTAEKRLISLMEQFSASIIGLVVLMRVSQWVLLVMQSTWSAAILADGFL